ncbi:hypothetical protein WJX81_000198 [Elliptochloris bilobata]|uniref:Kinesin motor domain-containing protein n=1 Tax=Elliptochloris bilobata TaxID=381761 RepID=A0AAW1QM00_9CHLO
MRAGHPKAPGGAGAPGAAAAGTRQGGCDGGHIVLEGIRTPPGGWKTAVAPPPRPHPEPEASGRPGLGRAQSPHGSPESAAAGALTRLDAGRLDELLGELGSDLRAMGTPSPAAREARRRRAAQRADALLLGAGGLFPLEAPAPAAGGHSAPCSPMGDRRLGGGVSASPAPRARVGSAGTPRPSVLGVADIRGAGRSSGSAGSTVAHPPGEAFHGFSQQSRQTRRQASPASESQTPPASPRLAPAAWAAATAAAGSIPEPYLAPGDFLPQPLGLRNGAPQSLWEERQNPKKSGLAAQRPAAPFAAAVGALQPAQARGDPAAHDLACVDTGRAGVPAVSPGGVMPPPFAAGGHSGSMPGAAHARARMPFVPRHANWRASKPVLPRCSIPSLEGWSTAPQCPGRAAAAPRANMWSELGLRPVELRMGVAVGGACERAHGAATTESGCSPLSDSPPPPLPPLPGALLRARLGPLDADGRSYAFDEVLLPGGPPEALAAQAAPLVAAALAGGTAAALALGRSGSGKSWCLSGSGGPQEPGLMARLAEQLFAGLAVRAAQCTEAAASGATPAAAVHMTAFEIVNERVVDLLAPVAKQRRGHGSASPGARHEVFRDAAGRAHVSNLAALPLAGAAEFARALSAAFARRSADPGGPNGARPPRHGAATFVVTLLVAPPAGGGPLGKLALAEVAGGSVAAAASAAGASTAGRSGAAALRQRLSAAASAAARQHSAKGPVPARQSTEALAVAEALAASARLRGAALAPVQRACKLTRYLADTLCPAGAVLAVLCVDPSEAAQAASLATLALAPRLRLAAAAKGKCHRNPSLAATCI